MIWVNFVEEAILRILQKLFGVIEYIYDLFSRSLV